MRQTSYDNEWLIARHASYECCDCLKAKMNVMNPWECHESYE